MCCIGITADIEKEFHQIMGNTNDSDMLRLLWVDDVISRKPQVVQYQFCRLVFGITPSPAILQCVIQHHLSQYKNSHAEIVKLLSDTLYVDDFFPVEHQTGKKVSMCTVKQRK